MAQVLVNEIHYDPDVKPDRVEFVELYNAGPGLANLSGWQLADAVAYTFLNGTSLASGGYVVIAENPSAILAKFGVNALGPWVGSLNNSGDHVALVNSAGGIEDEVNYQLGFPWPTVGDPPGYSIELVNPGFDNILGGNWRASVSSSPLVQTQLLIAAQSSWRYFKGLSEASLPDTTAWRAPDFDDNPWSSGTTPIGYDPALPMGTYLSDMQSNYTTVFFRQRFVVGNASAITALSLAALYNDGFKVWVNGQPVLGVNMSAGEVPFDATAILSREDYTYRRFDLNSPQNYVVAGTNVIAIQAANISLGDSPDFFFDARLTAQGGPITHGPTPGAMNSVFAANLPPQIRQVDHSPNQPAAGEPVTITAKITDPQGVTNAILQYQLVDPGNYIDLTDAAYTNNWASLVMNDSGINGDAQAGDSTYTAVLPGSFQQHRRLIRYRIRAVDATGLSVTVPYPDDPQPNFAYFCYNGVPAWQAAARPGVTPLLNFDTNTMRRLPVVHLLAKSNSVANATWFSRYSGNAYPWMGTLVFDGKVYDHIHYRTRGGVWRYAMVKNMWKFDLNRGHEMEMRDDYGKKYNVKWSKLNLGACIQQGDYGHRGEQGMFESVGFRLFNLVGTEAPNTTFLQFRIIDDAVESSSTTQYESDFWGLYLAVEQEDGRFLDEHDLPDGNFYKMESGTGELNNVGPLGPTDKSDLNAFLTYGGASPADDWWRTNLDLARYYGYRTIVEGIHHYDIDSPPGKNYFYYLDPVDHHWSVHSWDLDLTWANNMYGGGNEPFKSRVLTRAAFSLENKNRTRELRDLLFNTNQAWKLIDECAGLLRGPTNTPTILDADRCQWDYNPKMANSTYSSALSKAGQGLFYQWPNESTVSKDFNGCVQLMKNYVVTRGTTLDSLATDSAIPAQPSLTYLGPSNHPLNQLIFRSSAYFGTNSFAAMKWRIGEVTDTSAPSFDPAEHVHYEITAAWESPELPVFASDLTIPSSVAKVGHAYRVRVRMKDNTGRWSRWSAAQQFVVGLPDNAASLVANLQITELMYNPIGGSDFEFIELHNASPSQTLNLDGAKFTDGIDYTFTAGVSIPPDGYLLVTRTPDQAAFRAHYGLSGAVPLAGPYLGSLANEGEQLTLKTGAGGLDIFSFQFGNGRGWPLGALGAGHSLVPADTALNGQATGALDYPGNWRASSVIGGSPGQADSPPFAPTVLLNEITAHTDYSDPLHPEYDSNDWIELHNTTSTNIPLAGWYLSDDPANPQKWAIPAVVVPAHGWIVFDEVSGFHHPITTGFGLDKAGEQVLLSCLTGSAQNRVADAIQFKGQENGVSLGRFPDGAANWFTMQRTSNTVNRAGLVSLVINEVMYHPPNLGTNDNTRDEYIQIYNPTTQPITFQGADGPWRLDGGIGFNFPSNTTLPAGSVMLLVNFNPADFNALATFRGVYGLANLAVPILGPYTGKLGNRSDRVAIEKPQYPDVTGDPYSWVIVDEMIYGNQSPWPTNANGGGCALHRISPSRSGNDPANWAARLPTPGLANSPPLDRDGDGLPDAWEVQYALNPDDPSDANLDSDGDRLSNLAEFVCGTNPRDPASALRFDSAVASLGTVTLHFTAMADKSYTIQFRATAGTGAWVKLADISAAPAERAMAVPDALGATARFYRLVTPALP